MYRAFHWIVLLDLFIHLSIYLSIYLCIYLSTYRSIDLLPVAELIIQNLESAGAMDLVGMLCQYGGLSEALDVSRGA